MSSIDNEFAYTFKLKNAYGYTISTEAVIHIFYILNKLNLVPEDFVLHVRNNVQLKRAIYTLCYKNRNNIMLRKELKILFNEA